MDILNCTSCGITFGMPDGYLNDRRHDRKTFCCPNGHSMSYRESEADKLRRERDKLKQENARLEEACAIERQQRDAVERSLIAQKAVTTRLKNRAAAGICPCCNRSFVQLARHMKTKHPGFRTAEVVELKERA